MDFDKLKQVAKVALWAFGSASLLYLGNNLSQAEALGWGAYFTAAINTGFFAVVKFLPSFKPAADDPVEDE